MPQQETTFLRIPREGFVPDLELRVTHRKRDVHVREWWLPSSSENFVPSSKGIAIHPSELDAVIAALTEAKRLLEQTWMPRQGEALCPRCQNPEARQNRQAGTTSGSLPSDYYCGLCGAVDRSLRKEPSVIDLRGDDSGNWLHEVRRRRLERERHEGGADSAA